MDKLTLRELLRQLYIRACLDALDPKSEGKGKQLCEERLDILLPKILSYFKELLPVRKKYHPEAKRRFSPETCCCQCCKHYSYNQCRADIIQKIELLKEGATNG